MIDGAAAGYAAYARIVLRRGLGLFVLDLSGRLLLWWRRQIDGGGSWYRCDCRFL